MWKRTKSRVEAKRCRIMLLLDEVRSPTDVERMVGCARSTVYMTMHRFREHGVLGLSDQRRHRQPIKATVDIRAQLLSYLDAPPDKYGWFRSTWTRELLALQLEQDTDVRLSAQYVSTILRQEKCRYGRPRPALRIPVRNRRKILDAIDALVASASAEEEVFFGDEVDIHLNPRIGPMYIRRGEQPLVLTPGKNVKYYIAGALNICTGRVLYGHGEKKNSSLFIESLKVLCNAYRRARRIHLVLDNYVIHKSSQTQKALEEFDGRIQLHFLPPYSPEHNPIERLWKQLHDNVTRNHRHPTMESLWRDIVQFLDAVHPFPGTKTSTMKTAA